MFGVSFLYPAFLIGAVAAAVPVVLHLLRKEAAPPVRFPAVRFLTHVPAQRTRRRRLRELVLLALRVGALLLLAAAFARPYLPDRLPVGGPVTVVAVDTSFSLSAPGRFERARDLARRAIDDAPEGSPVAVVAFDDEATLLASPSGDREAARTALVQIEPGFGGTRYRAALDRALTVIGGRGGRIMLVTDLQRTGWRADAEGAVPSTVEVQAVDVGGLPSNLAVVDLIREGDHAIATVRNGGAGVRQGRIRLDLDGREAASTPFAAEPGETIDVEFEVRLPDFGVARVVLEDPTGFSADDERFLVLDPPLVPPLLVVTARGARGDEAFYLLRALDAASGAAGYRTRVVSGAEVQEAIDGDESAAFAAVLLLATSGVDRRAGPELVRYVERGGGLLVAAGNELDGEIVDSLLAPAGPIRLEPRRPASAVTLAPVDPRHPVFRPFGALAGNLGQVRFSRVATIEENGWAPLARFSDGTPALVERRVGDGRIVVFASDLGRDWSDFPLHAAFVPFAHEVVRHVVGGRQPPSAYLLSDAPATAGRRPGVVSVGTPPRRVAVNVDPRESDPARQTAHEFEAEIRRLNVAAARQAEADDRRIESDQSFWRYGLMLMLVALAAEGLIGRRG